MRVLCVGEMMADLLVHPVPEIVFDNDADSVEEIAVKSGGDANNNAIDLAKLGNEVYLVTLAGRDALADNCLKIAQEAGVCVDYAKRSTDTDQTRSLILINDRGDRHFLQYPGTSAKFCFEDVDLSLLDKTKDRTGKWTAIAPCYPHLDYFLPSIEQAACIAGTEDERRIADYFLERGVGTVAIKLGTRGCYCKNKDRAFYCGRYTVPVAETTGAGDAFVAGFLTELGHGGNLEDCVRFATATSAHAVQAFGATAGVPDYDTVRRFMAERPALEIRAD